MEKECVSEIGKKFAKAFEQLRMPAEKEKTDYLGVNLYDRAENDIAFKLYCSNSFSTNCHHPVRSRLKERDMLRNYSEVKNSGQSGGKRIDIALKNRTNENMESLFQTLAEMTPLFCESEKEMREPAQMKITDLPEHQYASLYHIGMIWEKEITLLKYHFFTKWCEEPNVPGKRCEYRDSYYLAYLKKCGNFYEKLTGITEQFLAGCNSHLWMAGMDTGENHYRKYKIYVKIFEKDADTVCSALKAVWQEYSSEMQKKIDGLHEWRQRYPEYQCAGAAFAYDTEGQFSLNIYYLP